MIPSSLAMMFPPAQVVCVLFWPTLSGEPISLATTFCKMPLPARYRNHRIGDVRPRVYLHVNDHRTVKTTCFFPHPHFDRVTLMLDGVPLNVIDLPEGKQPGPGLRRGPDEAKLEV